jgi:hypothetical protein
MPEGALLRFLHRRIKGDGEFRIAYSAVAT